MPESATIGSRASGILLHPTSLPGPGVGDLGEQAFRFVDWLAEAGQSLWQLLPLVAVNEGGSPYNALSAFAGNPLLLSPAELHLHGLLPADAAAAPDLDDDDLDFPSVMRWKEQVVRASHALLAEDEELRADFAAYRADQAAWLDDYALFRALRDAHGGACWAEWPAPLRERHPNALEAARHQLFTEVERHAYAQYLFDVQWSAVRGYANDRGIRIVGDVPIFVAYDSADVWAHPELFELDEDLRPTVVSGVPPDYFSKTGQRWGNPLYRWDVLRETGYRWWIDRFRRTLEMVDVVRIDHFRGFESYWEVPAEEETAMHGEWRPGPGRALFDAVRDELGALPVIAEDLGVITEEVEALRDDLDLPGMRVLQFAFGGDDPKNPHLPRNYVHNAVAYTGTHDNDTVLGWYADAGRDERSAVDELAGGGGEMHWRLIETVLRSEAGWAVVPLQDVLGLGGQARMNTPGVAEGNWAWRLREGALTPDLARRLAEIVRRTGRAPEPRSVDGARDDVDPGDPDPGTPG
ncbi:MAG TPA: 4-alpha-glucanotransferase [Longimicrobium sp.]|jgi:4-alpha-glucanotransferase|uniref:4-alpha-glucanotransferase n=1 Tax=Longimicrobium sp. TaxID=2029185 RepID=UPI002EDA1862